MPNRPDTERRLNEERLDHLDQLEKSTKQKRILHRIGQYYVVIVFPGWSFLYALFFLEDMKQWIIESADPTTIGIIHIVFIMSACLQCITGLLLFFSGNNDPVRQYAYIQRAYDVYISIKKAYGELFLDHEKQIKYAKMLNIVAHNTAILQENGFLFQEKSVQEHFDFMFEPFFEILTQVMNYSGYDSYCFAIYIHFKGKLHSIYKKKSAKLIHVRKQRRPRAWPLGTGFVGKCFQYDQGGISEDISEETKGTKFEHPEDSLYYKGAIALPLRVTPLLELQDNNEYTYISDKVERYGIMVLTSSSKGQFAEKHLELLRDLKFITERYIYTLVREKENVETVSVTQH